MPAFSPRAAADHIRSVAAEHTERIYGLRVGERVPCPIHGADSSNFEVHDNGRWSCYSRNAHGDAIDFIAQRDHGLNHGERVSGALFTRCLGELLEALGVSADDLPHLTREEEGRNTKPYPPLAEIEVLLGEAVPPLYALKPDEDGSQVRLTLNGRERPGIGSYATLHGLDMDGPGLVRILRGTKNVDVDHRPEWARKWRQAGVILPTYTARGELASVRYRTLGPSKAFGKGCNPGKKGQFAAGQLLLNRPARELLAGDTRAKTTAREHGVILTEGDASHLAWSSRHPGPVLGAPGVAIPAPALARIPRDAPVLLDFDPDLTGATYRDKALAGLGSHLDVRWSARMTWYFETEPTVRADVMAEQRPKTRHERDAAEKLIAQRLEALRIERAA